MNLFIWKSLCIIGFFRFIVLFDLVNVVFFNNLEFFLFLVLVLLKLFVWLFFYNWDDNWDDFVLEL